MSAAERKEIVDELIASLEAKGLVLVPATELENMERKKTEQRLLSRAKLTPYQIAKFGLIPGVKSMKTIKNMATDGSGRLGKHDHYTDKNGKHFVMTSAVKRLRGE